MRCKKKSCFVYKIFLLIFQNPHRRIAMQNTDRQILDGIVGRVWGPDATDWGNWVELNVVQSPSKFALSKVIDQEIEILKDPGCIAHLSVPPGPVSIKSMTGRISNKRHSQSPLPIVKATKI